jgi:hypothetical protein
MAKTNPKHAAVKREFIQLFADSSRFTTVAFLKAMLSSSSRDTTNNYHSVSRGTIHTSDTEDNTQLRF